MASLIREPCAFCHATADITGEHVWSAWAGRKFGEKLYTFLRKEPDGRERKWEKRELNHKTKVVCSGCNSGWMSALENQVKPIIEEMVCSCSHTILQSGDLAVIAQWAFVKAIVAEHSHNNRNPFYEFAERQAYRETLSVPAGVQMWMASVPKQHGLFKSGVAESPQNTPRRFELQVFTYSLGHLVVQVVTPRWKRKSFRKYERPPSLTQNPAWDECSIPFWPNDQTPIPWPAQAHMSIELANEYAERWKQVECGW